MTNSILPKFRKLAAAGTLLLLLTLIIAPVRAETLPDSSNLLVWLNADTGVSTTGGFVTNWADQSGNGNDASQATVGDQPLLIPDAINGNAAISFNGLTDYLSMYNSLDLTSGMSIFIVADNNVRKNYNGLFQIGATAGSPFTFTDNFDAFWQAGTTDAGSGNLFTFVNSNLADEGASYDDDAPPAVGNDYIYNYNATTTTSSTFIDNNNIGTHIESGTLPTSAGYGTIGLGYGGAGDSGLLSGDIAEVIIYNTALDTADQDAVYNYLDAKYLEQVPEPSTWILLMLSVSVGVIIHRWRKSVRD